MIRNDPNLTTAEAMDDFSDDLELLGKYIFSSIPTLV